MKKSIKYFKYKNTYEFEKLLREHGYRLEEVDGFSVVGKKQYRGNILKVYSVWFNDYSEDYFKVVYFKSLNECNRSRLGFNGNKLLR